MPAVASAVDDPLAGLHPDVAAVVRVLAEIELRRLSERVSQLELAGRDGGANSGAGEQGRDQGGV